MGAGRNEFEIENERRNCRRISRCSYYCCWRHCCGSNARSSSRINHN